MSRREDFPHVHRITTRWDDNDAYGHVNNVRYYAFFDTAINEFTTSLWQAIAINAWNRQAVATHTRPQPAVA